MGHLSSQDFGFPISPWGHCKDRQTNRAAPCADSGIRPLGYEIPAWLPVSCVALGKSFDLSELEFPHLQNQNRNSPYLPGLLWGSTETLHTQCSGEWLTLSAHATGACNRALPRSCFQKCLSVLLLVWYLAHLKPSSQTHRLPAPTRRDSLRALGNSNPGAHKP